MKVYFYKIVDSKDETNFYIGSTVNISRRKSHHKKSVTNRRHKKYWCKLYLYIRQHGGWVSMVMTKIHEIECATLADAHKEEQAIINICNPPLNSIKSCKDLNCTTTYKAI